MSPSSPLILLHGNFASPRWWEPVRQQLSGNVTTFAPDMRLWVENGQTTIPGLAGRLGEFIQAHGLVRPVIAGHSLGGVVATQFALDQSDTARALVLIDTGPPEGIPLGRFVVGWRMPGQRLRRRVLRAALGKAGLPRRHPLADALVEDALASDPVVYAAFSRAVARWNVSGRLGELRLPTLLIWGERDPITPVEIGWRLRNAIPHSQLVILRGVGHSPPVEVPEAVVEHLLAFLEEQRPAPPEPAATTMESWPRRLLSRLAGWLNRILN